MEERNRIRYETLFYCQKLEVGFLSGDNARALFIRSKLPLLDLTRIWKLSDITRDNKLDVFEFSLAMHFIELKLMGGEIPKQNYMITIADNNQEVVFPIITVEEKQQIKDIFEYADTNSQGFLEMDIVKPMLSSGLSPSTLSRIWNIADLDRAGKLCLFEFTIAMHLVKNCAKGINLNGPVNPFACLPDEDNAVRLYKEKLAIFDKEFLLKQQNNKELFLNSTDSADPAAVELLTGYLFDGQHVSPRGKSEPDFVDENRNVFHRGKEKSSHDYHQHNVLVSSQDCDSVVKEGPHVDCTETIESNKINKNELNIDLENIFETVSKENMGECEEAPKFIAKPPVGYAETEEDEEEIPVLPTFQRRTYYGKDLIFEDPIGSELIGDVEFEVDFNYIINDIEKEMVDEERRLPIARVLPIYKTPPVLDEQPYEKSITTKGSRDVDLNFIDVKTGGFYEQENLGSNNRRNDIVIGRVTKESQISHKGMIINQGPTSYKDDIYTNPRKGNTKNFDVDDIVEQKRLLLQNEQEERKKLREGRHNESKDQHSASLSSIPVVENAEQINYDKSSYNTSQGKDTKRQDNLNYTNYHAGVQRKYNRSIFEKEGVAAISSNSGEGSYMNEKETNLMPEDNVTRIVKSNENDGYNKSNNANHYEDEEEKRRVREAEDKEKLLLERINFLEKKRQQLCEKKRRERDSNNVGQEHKVYANQEDKENNQVSEKFRNYEEQNSTSSTWSSNSKHDRNENNEDEKRRLAEALAAKRKTEAELERQREEVLRAAEERRLEEEAKQQEEQEAAKERKRNFLENLQRLKQRVLTEEEEKSKESKSQPKREPSRAVHNAGRFSPGLSPSNKSQSLHGYTKGNDMSAGADSSNAIQKNVLPQTKSSQYEANVERKHQGGNEDDSSTVKPDENLRNEEDQRKAHEMRRENFKSNRELFMKKIQTEAEQNVQVQRREKNKNVRPKSFYGGMFNKPVHQIIDDSLLAQNVDSTSVGDLVDEEALKQFQREQELKKEHEKVNKLRSSLERESSYTVENVERLFCETDTEIKKQAGNDWDNLRRKEATASSHPHRRSLVNTLTTEWDSFLDVLEEDKRRESETIKMRQEISAQEEDSNTFETNLRATSSSKSYRQEPGDKRFDQETVIKENAPKRKTDLAHAWTHMISNQQNTDE